MVLELGLHLYLYWDFDCDMCLDLEHYLNLNGALSLVMESYLKLDFECDLGLYLDCDCLLIQFGTTLFRVWFPQTVLIVLNWKNVIIDVKLVGLERYDGIVIQNNGITIKVSMCRWNSKNKVGNFIHVKLKIHFTWGISCTWYFNIFILSFILLLIIGNYYYVFPIITFSKFILGPCFMTSWQAMIIIISLDVFDFKSLDLMILEKNEVHLEYININDHLVGQKLSQA